MAPRGRKPLGEDVLQSRLADYCRRYGVSPGDTGLPPYPAGRRESPQHREWLAVYKAVMRLRQRSEPMPVAEPTCVACAEPLTGSRHPDCELLLDRLRALGPAGLDRLRAVLWPGSR